MSEESKKQTHKLSDDLIAVLRELIQLSIITGTNVVDHMRAVRVELDDKDAVVPTEEYINQYNKYIQDLEKQATDLREEMQNKLATDADDTVSN